MKAHSVDPQALSALLAQDHPFEGYAEELRTDMRAYPEIYYADHVDVCRARAQLPLSLVAWRRACLSR